MSSDFPSSTTTPLDEEAARQRFLLSMGLRTPTIGATPPDAFADEEGPVAEEEDEIALSSRDEDFELPGAPQGTASNLRESRRAASRCRIQKVEFAPGRAVAASAVLETETETEAEAEAAVEAEAAAEAFLPLECPKCRGELVLKREHLGVEGACVWCGAGIVATESGPDRAVRVFALFQPGKPTREEAVSADPVAQSRPIPELAPEPPASVEAAPGFPDSPPRVEWSDDLDPLPELSEAAATKEDDRDLYVTQQEAWSEPAPFADGPPQQEAWSEPTPFADMAPPATVEIPDALPEEPASEFSARIEASPWQDTPNPAWGQPQGAPMAFSGVDPEILEGAPHSDLNLSSDLDPDDSPGAVAAGFAGSAEINSSPPPAPVAFDRAPESGFSGWGPASTRHEDSSPPPASGPGGFAIEAGPATSGAAAPAPGDPAAFGFAEPIAAPPVSANETEVPGGFLPSVNAVDSQARPSLAADDAAPAPIESGFRIESASADPLFGGGAFPFGEDEASPSAGDLPAKPSELLQSSSPPLDAVAPEESFSNLFAKPAGSEAIASFFSSPADHTPATGSFQATAAEAPAPPPAETADDARPPEAGAAELETLPSSEEPRSAAPVQVESKPLGTPPRSGGPRKEFLILMMVIVGLVCGAALASFVLPVGDYVVSAKNFMESLFPSASGGLSGGFALLKTGLACAER